MHKERLIHQQKGFDKDFVDRHREDLGLLFIDEEGYEEEEEELMNKILWLKRKIFFNQRIKGMGRKARVLENDEIWP